MKLGGRYNEREVLGSNTVGGQAGKGCGATHNKNIARGGAYGAPKKSPFSGGKQKGGNYYAVKPSTGGLLLGPGAGPAVVEGGKNCATENPLNMKASKQHGGSNVYKAKNAGYGFPKVVGHELAGDLRGSYAPTEHYTHSTATCGGARKATKKVGKKTGKKYVKKTAGKKDMKKHAKKTAGKRKMKKHAKKTAGKRKMKGGKYYQYGSNIADTPGYSVPGRVLPGGADAPGSRTRYINTENKIHN